MTVTVYKSSDASAPVLTGATGTLIQVLDACLVNGYGAQLAAGWTKPFSGTNQAIYRQGTGNQLYLQILDTAATYATAWGYVTATGILTGTGQFPNAATVTTPTDSYWVKATIAGSTPLDWIVIATSKAFYIWINAGGAPPYVNGQVYFFGEIQSFKSGDSYNTLIISNGGPSQSNINFNNLGTAVGVTAGHYMARSYTQLGSGIQVGKHAEPVQCGTALGRGGLQFPNVIDGSITLVPVWVHEPVASLGYPIRGVIPGLWAQGHTAPLSHGDTFSGTGTLTGKTFIAVNTYYTGSIVCQPIIETSNTW